MLSRVPAVGAEGYGISLHVDNLRGISDFNWFVQHWDSLDSDTDEAESSWPAHFKLQNVILRQLDSDLPSVKNLWLEGLTTLDNPSFWHSRPFAALQSLRISSSNVQHPWYGELLSSASIEALACGSLSSLQAFAADINLNSPSDVDLLARFLSRQTALQHVDLNIWHLTNRAVAPPDNVQKLADCLPQGLKALKFQFNQPGVTHLNLSRDQFSDMRAEDFTLNFAQGEA